jgi:hypothetical protein
MKRLFIVLALAGLTGAATATAQPSGSTVRPGITQVCVDTDGSTLPVVCRGAASRINPTQDFCSCPQGQRVDAPVCGPDERPHADNREFRTARREAARDGSLIGDRFEGASFCTDLRSGAG